MCQTNGKSSKPWLDSSLAEVFDEEVFEDCNNSSVRLDGVNGADSGALSLMAMNKSFQSSWKHLL